MAKKYVFDRLADERRTEDREDVRYKDTVEAYRYLEIEAEQVGKVLIRES